MVGPSNTINPALYDKLNFNFIRDIAPVAGVIRAPFVLERADFPARPAAARLKRCPGDSGP
jgi:hypothetical protein